MNNLCKLNYLSSLSFIIIGVFLYITSDGHQSFSDQDREEETSDINNNEESTSNDIFSDLSRNLPSIDEKSMNENGEPLESDEPLFGNPDTEALNDNNGMDNSENIVESNDQRTPSQEKSFSSGFSDGGKETDIINEDGDDSGGNIETSSSSSSSSSSNEARNDENNNIKK